MLSSPEPPRRSVLGGPCGFPQDSASSQKMGYELVYLPQPAFSCLHSAERHSSKVCYVAGSQPRYSCPLPNYHFWSWGADIPLIPGRHVTNQRSHSGQSEHSISPSRCHWLWDGPALLDHLRTFTGTVRENVVCVILPPPLPAPRQRA